MKNAVGEDATDPIGSVISQLPQSLMAGVVIVGWIPGFVDQAFFFSPPAQFLSYISASGWLAAGLPKA